MPWPQNSDDPLFTYRATLFLHCRRDFCDRLETPAPPGAAVLPSCSSVLLTQSLLLRKRFASLREAAFPADEGLSRAESREGDGSRGRLCPMPFRAKPPSGPSICANLRESAVAVRPFSAFICGQPLPSFATIPLYYLWKQFAANPPPRRAQFPPSATRKVYLPRTLSPPDPARTAPKALLTRATM